MKTEARSTQNWKTKHPRLENEAPKSRKRNTKNWKTKHPSLETCLSFKNTRQFLVKSPMLIQQESSTITNRMQYKTIQVKLRGVANAFAVENCHRWKLLCAIPSFQVAKNFENRQKRKRRRSARVGQADFGKLQLNSIRNHGGNSQRLSVKCDQFETQSIRNKRCQMFRPLRFRGRMSSLLFLAILRLLRKHSNKHSIVVAEKVGMVDELLKFIGKTSDRRKCSRSAPAD